MTCMADIPPPLERVMALPLIATQRLYYVPSVDVSLFPTIPPIIRKEYTTLDQKARVYIEWYKVNPKKCPTCKKLSLCAHCQFVLQEFHEHKKDPLWYDSFVRNEYRTPYLSEAPTTHAIGDCLDDAYCRHCSKKEWNVSKNDKPKPLPPVFFSALGYAI